MLEDAGARGDRRRTGGASAMPLFDTITISPGSTERMKVAPTMSSATVSEAKT